MAIDDARLSEARVVDGAKLLPAADTALALSALEGWVLVDEGRAIQREFTTKSFVRAQAIAALAGGIGEMANHHPDISYGWGYARIRFTTHSAGGVTLNDLICAARLNAVC